MPSHNASINQPTLDETIDIELDNGYQEVDQDQACQDGGADSPKPPHSLAGIDRRETRSLTAKRKRETTSDPNPAIGSVERWTKEAAELRSHGTAGRGSGLSYGNANTSMDHVPKYHMKPGSVWSEQTHHTANIRDDGGREFEVQYLKEIFKTKEFIGHPKVATDGDADTVRGELRDALLTSVFGDGEDFLPCDELVKIMHPTTVDMLLAADSILLPGLCHGESSSSIICPPVTSDKPSYRGILAALLLVTEKNLIRFIVNFVEEKVDDTKLHCFGKEKDGCLSVTQYPDQPRNLTSKLEWEDQVEKCPDRHILTFTRDWSNYDKGQFLRYWQWRVRPVFFGSLAAGPVHFTCLRHQVFPFCDTDERHKRRQSQSIICSHPPQDYQTLHDYDDDHTEPSESDPSQPGVNEVHIYSLHTSQQSLNRYTVRLDHSQQSDSKQAICRC